MPQKYKVYVTSPRIPKQALERLGRFAEITVHPDRPITKNELISVVQNFDGVLALLRDRFDAEVLSHATRLRVISNYAVGYDNIDIQKATGKGIWVTNTPDVLSNATAELAIALMFSVARRLLEADQFLRQGKFRGWEPDLFLGIELAGRTFGLLGAGRIGTLTALKAYGLGMRVVYFSRKRNLLLEAQTGAKKLDLESLLETADVVSIHLPLTPETHHLLDLTRLQKMKPGAILINTGRGPIIDEKALVQVLREGRLAGAGLDVYEFEPEVTPELLEFPNVVLLPHIGSATHRARNAMAEVAVENLIHALQGQRPPSLVNPEVLGTP